MNLQIGNTYDVTVVKILPVGAVVRLEDGSTELVHISNIADCYISDVADFVSVGNEYVATCEEGNNRPIQLSFKPLGLKSQRVDSDERSNYHKPATKNANLDEMIDSANSSYAEKQTYEKKRSQRR